MSSSVKGLQIKGRLEVGLENLKGFGTPDILHSLGAADMNAQSA